jgi:hypothetical protein
MNIDAHSDAGSVLSEYMTQEELATQINKSPRTIARWRRLREGPPVTYIGRTPYYYRPSTREWLASQEVEA